MTLIPSAELTAGIHCETSGNTNELPAPVRLPALAVEPPLVCAAAEATDSERDREHADRAQMTVLLLKTLLLL